MKATVFAVISLTALAAIVANIGPAYGQPSSETAPIFVRNIPQGTGTGGWSPWLTKRVALTVLPPFWATT
jgi:hypothetical protein